MRFAVLGLVLIAMATPAGGAESTDERLRAAEALLLAGDHTSAEPIFRAVYEETQSARSAYFVAVICVMTGRIEEGERLLKRALDREPGYGQAWKALGLLYEQESRHDEAAPAFRRLLKLQPGDERARLLLGKALAGDGKSREAELVLTESRIIYCQSRQREDCFQKAVIKRGLRRIRRSALRARSSSSQ